MAFLFLGPLLCGCNHHAATLQEKIIGTWINGNTNNTMTFNPDGNYLLKSQMDGYVFRSNILYGQWQIEGDLLIMTLTNVTGTEFSGPTGHVTRVKITHLDEDEFDYEIGTNEIPLPNPLPVHLIREK
jgi:hypothetical protein